MGSVAGFVPDKLSEQPQKYFPVDGKFMKFYSRSNGQPPPDVISAFAADP